MSLDLHENEHANKTHFYLKGCAPGLVLKPRQKATRKWSIGLGLWPRPIWQFYKQYYDLSTESDYSQLLPCGHHVITYTRYYGQNPALHPAKAIEV